MENGSATRDTTPPYAGTAIELTLTARHAKHPTIAGERGRLGACLSNPE